LDRLKKIYLKNTKRDRVVKRYEVQQATKAFRQYEKKGNFLNPLSVERDIQNVTDLTKPIVITVNSYLAHNSKIKKYGIPGLKRTKDCFMR